MMISIVAWRLKSNLSWLGQKLDNIQRKLSQLMTGQNNEENSDNNEQEENRTPENKNTKESSSLSIDAELIKGFQA